jgi:hypothetical protein
MRGDGQVDPKMDHLVCFPAFCAFCFVPGMLALGACTGVVPWCPCASPRTSREPGASFPPRRNANRAWPEIAHLNPDALGDYLEVVALLPVAHNTTPRH